MQISESNMQRQMFIRCACIAVILAGGISVLNGVTASRILTWAVSSCPEEAHHREGYNGDR
jgi:hypothetical protein